MGPLMTLWLIIYFIQIILGFQMAYWRTKQGGDNGIALIGWLFAFYIIAFVPGMGIYRYFQYRAIYKKEQEKEKI